MSAAVVEIKDDETHAYYRGYVKDFDNQRLLIRYEGGWKPDAWVAPDKVRLSVQPHDAASFQPKPNDLVETMAKSHEDEPYSWWHARVKTVRGDFYLIAYTGFDEAHNEIVEKDMLRPVNPHPHLNARDLVRIELDIPQQLWETEDEKHDQNYQLHKQNSYTALQSQSLVLSLVEDQSRHKLVVFGEKSHVDKLRKLSNLYFKHEQDLRGLARQRKKTEQQLEEEKRKLTEGVAVSFQVEDDLLGLVIGKSGANVRNAEKLPGIISIAVSKEGTVRILAKDKDSAEAARKKLQYVKRIFPVPSNMVGRFVGKNFENLREIEKSSGVRRIVVPRQDGDEKDGSRDDAQDAERGQGQSQRGGRGGASQRGERGGRGGAGQRGGRGGGAPRGGRGDNQDIVQFEVLGSAEAVDDAMMLLQSHMKHLQDLSAGLEDIETTRKQLKQLNTDYGLARNFASRKPRESPNGQTADAEEAGADAPDRDSRRRSRKPKENSAAASPDAGDAAAAGSSPNANANAGNGRNRNRNRGPKQGSENKQAESSPTADSPAAGAPAAAGGAAPAAGNKPARRERRERKPAAAEAEGNGADSQQ